MPLTLIRGKKNKGPDPAIVKDQLLWLQNLHKVYGTPYLARNLLWILRKNPEPDTVQQLPNEHWNRRLVPFRFNRIQSDLIKKLGERNIFLKPRQMGATTFFINIRLYLPAILNPGSGGLLISQTNAYATKHFRILQRAQRYVGVVDPTHPELNILHRQLVQNLLHVHISNRKELIFDQLDSVILCDSAEIEEVGQGVTVTNAVATECARWKGKPEETLANMKEAIVPGGTLDIESTANGMGGYFCEECFRAKDPQNTDAEFCYHFYPWFWHDEYRLEEALKEEELTEKERKVQEQFKLDLYQMAWRKKKMISLRHNFPEKYPEDDITCFITSGKSFFDRDITATRKLELTNYKPLFVSTDGCLQIFNKRVRGRRYILGADPAEGKQINSEHSDFSAAIVIDQETGEQMAAYRSKEAPEDFAFSIGELGKRYNDALICCERNKDGGTVLTTLERHLGYGAIYQHKEWWKQQKVIKEIRGYPTTKKTRPIAVNKIAEFFRENPDLIWDKIFVDECLTFVRDEKTGVPAGQEGYHDDTVMANAMASVCRLIILGYLDPVTWRSEPYGKSSEDADEDVT